MPRVIKKGFPKPSAPPLPGDGRGAWYYALGDGKGGFRNHLPPLPSPKAADPQAPAAACPFFQEKVRYCTYRRRSAAASASVTEAGMFSRSSSASTASNWSAVRR